MSPTRGYFDYNATTPVCSEAMEAFTSALAEFGNPSSKYGLAKSPKEGIARARAQVARLIGAADDEVIFTSGGTEANNWAIKGALLSRRAMDARSEPGHVLVSEIEHASVLQVADFLERAFGFQVTRLRPDSEGMISAKAVEASLRPDTHLVSIMLVNNEVGTLQPIRQIAGILRPRGVHLHVDGVQAVGKSDVDVHALGLDTMAFAGHKFHAPKGVGGLYIRRGVSVEPLLHGGGQEHGLRGGTEAVAAIVAMGAAARAAHAALPELVPRLAGFRDILRRLLVERVPGVTFNGPRDLDAQAPNTLSVCVEGVRAEALAALLDHMHGIQVSLGSACSNNKSVSLSHVLVAMGLSESAIRSTLRVSMGRYTHEDDLVRFADALASGVRTLKRISRTVRPENTTAA
jgi:cysteine desulfurase